jgi:hypothetical protein
MSVTVRFKDEDGELGPVVVIDHEVYDKDPVIAKLKAEGRVGKPFGYKPEGITDLGWLTRRQALAVAAEHGVTLEEW